MWFICGPLRCKKGGELPWSIEQLSVCEKCLCSKEFVSGQLPSSVPVADREQDASDKMSVSTDQQPLHYFPWRSNEKVRTFCH
jgi:hypothetical protein